MTEKEGRILLDLKKFKLAIEADTCRGGFYSQDYLLEKLTQIIEGKCSWHPLVNDFFEEK